MQATTRRARALSRTIMIVWALLALLLPAGSAFAGQGKPGVEQPTPVAKEAPGKPAAEQDSLPERTDDSCVIDDTQADFQAGEAPGLDLASRPGEVHMVRTEGRDQPPRPYTGGTIDMPFGVSWQRAQSFKPAVSGNLIRVVLHLRTESGRSAAPIIVELRDDSNGRPGAVRAGITITDVVSTSLERREIVFPTPQALVAERTYYISLRSTCDCYAAWAGMHNPYGRGDGWDSADGGATWSLLDLGSLGLIDMQFETHMLIHQGEGTYTSAVKDSDPAAGTTPLWGNLNWQALVPPGTSLRFQVAGGDSPAGPWNFTGPDGTAATYFTESGVSLAQLDGERYMRYRAYFTAGESRGPVLGFVYLCAEDAMPGAACSADSSPADFAAGHAAGLDLQTNPGQLALPAAEGVDQPPQPYTGGTIDMPFGVSWQRAQSFKPAVSGNLIRVVLHLRTESGRSAAPIIVELRDDSNGRPGAVRAGITITDVVSTSMERREIVFPTPQALVAERTYYISLRSACDCYVVWAGVGNPYGRGDGWDSADGGATWSLLDLGSLGLVDMQFETHMLIHQGEGTYTSAVKDSNPRAGTIPLWGNLSWSASVPRGTALRFQVAGSDSPAGPWNFAGPDGTAASYFTESGAALRQLYGKRYMRYEARLSSNQTHGTPRLFAVTTCSTTPTPPPMPSCQDVTWKNTANVFVSGNTIRKSRFIPAWDAGAASSRAISSGAGAAEAGIFGVHERFAFGLSKGDSSRHVDDIDFALATDPATRQIQVVEQGAVKGNFGAYFPGDTLRVEVQLGVVLYYHNGNLIYTSNRAPVYPLLLDSSLFNPGAQVYQARLCAGATLALPNIGVNAPAAGASSPGEHQQFVTTCSDPDGWRDIRTIDFRMAGRRGEGEQLVLWLVLDQDNGLVRFYDPDTEEWSEGRPGEERVLASAYAELHLAGTRIQGRGPTDPAVDVTWDVVFKQPAVGPYAQYLRIEDDEGQSTLDDAVGSWTVAGPCGQSFADVREGDYFHDAAYFLSCRGAISGYADGTFRPHESTTRGQMVKIVVLARGLELLEPAAPRFADVPASDAFYRYVETAAANDIISGYEDGTFRPYSKVTRGQLAKIVVVAMGWALAKPAEASFLDVPGGHPFYVFVQTAVAHGIVGGYEVVGGREFRPGNDATRAQIAKIVYLALTAGR